jgi:hypothetical protein
MSKIWKTLAISALVLSVVVVGTALTAQEHQHEATQEESGDDMDSMHEMDSGHDMGAMMAMMKEMMASMHEHMAMMHTTMAGRHGAMQGKHSEGMRKMQGEGMHKMQGAEGMQGGGMQGMMKMVDPAGIEDAAAATAAADKLAEHLEMMKTMMPKLEAQLEALRTRAEELSANGS